MGSIREREREREREEGCVEDGTGTNNGQARRGHERQYPHSINLHCICALCEILLTSNALAKRIVCVCRVESI